MELIRGQHNLKSRHRGCVATIGNFDGVHLGHQAIIEQLVRIGSDLALPSVLITFEPKPKEFFAGPNAPARLTRFREKLQLLQSTDLDRLLCLRFNAALASSTAQEFVEDLLVGKLGIRRLMVGDDFRFGRGANGDVAYLKRAGAQHSFEVVQRETFFVEGVRVSSSWIRNALARGDLDLAAKLLGRPYSMQGHVIRGDRIGRTIGFATANILLHRLVSPLSGVYAVQVQGIASTPLAGVANVGTRPTVNGTKSQLEVHILDFAQDIYGRHVTVDFLHHLRPETYFESLESLRRQIEQDVGSARAFFSGYAPTDASIGD